MLFEDYVNSELKHAGMLDEGLVVAKKDISGGHVRNKHVETSRADQKIKKVDGVSVVTPYLRPEELNRKRAQSRFGQKKRDAKEALIQAKRKRAFRLRRLMNIKYNYDDRLNNTKSQTHRELEHQEEHKPN